MKLYQLLLSISICFVSFQSIAQNNILEEVLEVKLRNMNEIMSEGQVIGYYLFYKKEKINRKETAFELVFLDTDLGKLSSTEIIGSKYLSVLEGVYNGNALLIKFIDPKKKNIIYKVFNNESEEIYEDIVKADKFELMMAQGMQGSDMEMYTPTMKETGTDGFVDSGFRKKKYEIRYYDNADKSKSWKFTPADGRKLQTSSIVYANNKHIVSMVMQRKSMMTTKGEYSLVTLDTKDGSIVSEEPTNEGNNNYLLLKGSTTNDGTTRLFGSYYEPGVNIVKEDPKGIIALQFDDQGSFGAEQKVSLKQIQRLGIQSKKGSKSAVAETSEEATEEKPKRKKKKSKKRKKKKKKSSKEMKDGLGNLFIHNIEQLDNGEVIVVGEYFKKKLDGGAMVGNILGSGSSMTKMTINDLVILRLSPSFEILEVKNIETNTPKCSLPNGALYYDANMMGYIVKYLNGFSYAFSQRTDSDDNAYSIAFRDRGEDKKEGDYIRFLNIVNGEYNEDRISLKTEASELKVLKAKPGHVLITEYYKKEKKLDMRLEQINF